MQLARLPQKEGIFFSQEVKNIVYAAVCLSVPSVFISEIFYQVLSSKLDGASLPGCLLRPFFKVLVASTLLSIACIVDEVFLKGQEKGSFGEKTVLYVVSAEIVSLPFILHRNIRNFLSQGEPKRFVFRRVDSISQIKQLCRVERNISHVWIVAHGNRYSLKIGRQDVFPRDLAAVFHSRCFSLNPTVVLHSCSTGIDFAKQFHRAMGSIVTVIAPIKKVNVFCKIQKGIDGEFSFFSLGKDITARFSSVS